jgi:replicative DNA helicase
MMEKGGIIKTAKITVDDTPNIQLHTLKARARAMRRKGAEAVFIDYLTLIRHNTSAPMWERVGEVSKQLKELARELDVPVVVLSQLGRQSEDKEPSLADMRQSGAVEEDADVVILLHRARETDGDEIEAKVHVAKNRHGDTGTVLLIFDRRHVRFREKDIIHGTK